MGGAGPGSVGWQAPEVMAMRFPSDVSARSEESQNHEAVIPDGSPLDMAVHSRTSRAVDIFSLGCIFYAALVPGSHPFGEWYEREANIMHNRPNMEALKELSPDAYDLVSSMVQRNPSLRPTAKYVCEHPYFWSHERRLAFLCDVSDRIESEYSTVDGSLPATFVSQLLAIEAKASLVVGTAWDLVLEESLLNNVQRFRTYDPSSVRDLLRLIRNKHHHYDELPDCLKAKIGSSTAGLLRYFESKFPFLLMHCYNAVRDKFSEDDPLLQKYCILSRKAKAVKAASDRAVPTLSESPLPPPTDIMEPVLEAISDTIKTESEVEQIVDAHSTGLETIDTKETKEDLPMNKACINENVPAMHIPESERKGEAVSLEHPSPHIGEDATKLSETSTQGIPDEIVVWECSTAARTFKNRGWSRSDEEWMRRTDATLIKANSNLVRCAEDPKFRTRLCNHWDVSLGTFCPMRKKNKCVFAHGPVELRVKEGKRNRWGKLVDKNGDNKNPQHSGGEDTYGAARSIETERRQEGKWNVDNGTTKGRKAGGSAKRKN
jgi:serine/threonine-protein kinase/endoribonuclease IRE1